LSQVGEVSDAFSQIAVGETKSLKSWKVAKVEVEVERAFEM
jgi:hypothetical protein